MKSFLRLRQCLAPLVLSLAVSLTFAQVNVTTYHNDNSRTGQNIQETVLTTSNVGYSTFGEIFSISVDGQVYAQPLVLGSVVINGVTHKVVYVATEHDSVYALDAVTGHQYWKTSFLGSGVTTAPTSGDGINCTDMNGTEYGITGTPVINPATNTLYVVAETYESGAHVHRLHALDVRTGLDVVGAQVIQGTYNGDNFAAVYQINRPGLLLENNHLIIAWGSHCDNPSYYGWVMSYNPSTLQQEAVYNDDQAGLQLNSGKGGGIWMAGGGVASDSSGNLYFATGNGDFGSLPSPTDFGCSILKLPPVPAPGVTWAPTDYFTPHNVSSLCQGSNDQDVGSGGVLLLPDQTGDTHNQLLVQMGKDGDLHLVDRNHLGGYCNGCGSNTNIVQEIEVATVGVWGSPAYWNGNVFYGGASTGGATGPVKAFSLYSTTPLLEFTSQTASNFSYPTPTPSVSAPSATSGGIVWFLDNSSYKSTCTRNGTTQGGCAVLYAFSSNLSTELYASSQAPWNTDAPGSAVKFTVPTIANGMVYVGTQNALTAYGKISSRTPQADQPFFSPPPSGSFMTLTVNAEDGTPGAVFHCTINGSPATPASPVCSNPLVSNWSGSNVTISAVATANGYVASYPFTATYIWCHCGAEFPAYRQVKPDSVDNVRIAPTEVSDLNSR